SLLLWSSFLMTKPIAVPVVLPSNTPDRISMRSDSWRCVTWRELPGLRRSRSRWMSLSASPSPGGQPSTTPPKAGPWLSPNEVTQYSRPKVLPDMKILAENSLGVQHRGHRAPSIDMAEDDPD